MNSERILIIGDVHGCLSALQRLVKKVRYDSPRDRLIFLGDYVDRGRDPRGVIEYLIDLSAGSHNVECLLGNHEAGFLDYLFGRDAGGFLANGGGSTLLSYRIDEGVDWRERIPPEHLQFLERLKPYVEMEEHYIVHAGMRPGVPIHNQTLEDLVWIRDTFIYSDYDFGKRVVFGHTPFSHPLVMPNKIGLDTGAVYGNRLTCLELPAQIFHSVGA